MSFMAFRKINYWDCSKNGIINQPQSAINTKRRFQSDHLFFPIQLGPSES